MTGRITKGTTYQGRALNEGDIVDLPEHEFYQFKLTGDIEPVPDEGKKPVVEIEPPVTEPSAKKPRK